MRILNNSILGAIICSFCFAFLAYTLYTGKELVCKGECSEPIIYASISVGAMAIAITLYMIKIYLKNNGKNNTEI